jgi:hypothetical protein
MATHFSRLANTSIGENEIRESSRNTLQKGGEDRKTTLETGGEDRKTTLETGGEDEETRQLLRDPQVAFIINMIKSGKHIDPREVKITLETSGEDVKTTLETSG